MADGGQAMTPEEIAERLDRAVSESENGIVRLPRQRVIEAAAAIRAERERAERAEVMLIEAEKYNGWHQQSVLRATAAEAERDRLRERAEKAEAERDAALREAPVERRTLGRALANKAASMYADENTALRAERDRLREHLDIATSTINKQDARRARILARFTELRAERDHFVDLCAEYAAEKAPDAMEALARDRDDWWKRATAAEAERDRLRDALAGVLDATGETVRGMFLVD